MAYKQSPGRLNMPKTGRGVDTVALMTGSPARQDPKKDPVDGFKKELQTVRQRDSEGGFMNTVKNIGTGLSHGWSSQGYDSKPSGSGLTYDSGGNKDLGKSISSAVSTAYNYATGNIPKAVTNENKPKKVRPAQGTYLD